MVEVAVGAQMNVAKTPSSDRPAHDSTGLATNYWGESACGIGSGISRIRLSPSMNHFEILQEIYDLQIVVCLFRIGAP